MYKPMHSRDNHRDEIKDFKNLRDQVSYYTHHLDRANRRLEVTIARIKRVFRRSII